MSTIDMEKAHGCDVRVHAYKNGKTMEQCREEARKNRDTNSRNFKEWGSFMDKSTRSGRS